MYMTPLLIHDTTGWSYVVIALCLVLQKLFGGPTPQPQFPGYLKIVSALFVLACGLHHLGHRAFNAQVHAAVDYYMVTISVVACFMHIDLTWKLWRQSRGR